MMDFKFPEPTKPRAPAPDSSDWVRFFTMIGLIVAVVPALVAALVVAHRAGLL